MAYTIIEVERKTGIPSTKIRFWIKKGLFSFLDTDKNGVRYFTEEDIGTLKWVEYLRKSKMPIADIKTYINAYQKGDSTLTMRKEMILNQAKILKKEITNLQEILKRLEEKGKSYEQLECARKKTY